MLAKLLSDEVVTIENQRYKDFFLGFDLEQIPPLDRVREQAFPGINYSSYSIESIAQQQRDQAPYYLQK